MTRALNDPAQSVHLREDWLARVRELADQIATWGDRQQWTVERFDHPIQERLLGSYSAPAVRVKLTGGEIEVIPVALQAGGADGRIDMKAYPTLSRVKLIGMPQGWQIMTDSNVPIRLPWSEETFVQLAHDLLA